MQTVTIAINNNTALKKLKELEEKHFISIVDKDAFDSPSIPGKSMSMSDFKKWIYNAEETPTISFEEAKSIWSGKKKQLQKLMK